MLHICFRRVTEKLDKSKKLRLSLDKFVPKNKQVSKRASIFDIKNLFKSHTISININISFTNLKICNQLNSIVQLLY